AAAIMSPLARTLGPRPRDGENSRLQPRSGPIRVGWAEPTCGRSTCAIDATNCGRVDVRCLATGRSPGARSLEIPGFASPPHDGFAEFSDRTCGDRVAVSGRAPAGQASVGQWDESPVRCPWETNSIPSPRVTRQLASTTGVD